MAGAVGGGVAAVPSGDPEAGEGEGAAGSQVCPQSWAGEAGTAVRVFKDLSLAGGATTSDSVSWGPLPWDPGEP